MSATPAGRTALRAARLLLLPLLLLYALVALAAFAFQRRLIYFPVRLAEPATEHHPARGEVVTFASGDGTRLYGLYVAPPRADAPVALVFHGNAGNVLTWAPYLDAYVRQGLGALLLDPRGYGWSEGEPGEEGWHQDADAALAWLGARGVASPRVVVVGVSIGAGLATPLAARHPVRGLVLQSAFTSLPEAAAEHYPFLPCSLLLRDRYENVRAAPGVRCPVLLLHGAVDDIVPPAHVERLAAAFPTRPAVHVAPGRGHNDVHAWSGYAPVLAEFLGGLR